MKKSNHFWFYLLNVGENIAALDPKATDFEKQLLSQLDSLQEIYGKNFDPVDEFEAYAAVNFSNSIRKLLAERNVREVEHARH